MATTDSENFYRVVSLLVDAGTEVLRKLFTKYALSSGATSIYQFMSNIQSQIFALQKKKYLKRHQLSLLLGQNPGTGIIDFDTWDINLLCVLLKNICPITQTEDDAVEKLRVLRNSVYSHAGQAKLSQSDFDSYWRTAEGEILSLSQGCGDPGFDQKIKESIFKIRTGPLSIESTVEALKLWYSQDKSTSTKLEDIDLKLDQLLGEVKGLQTSQKKSENSVLQKLQQYSDMVLKEFSLDSFVETAQFVKARQILKKENAVFICGAAGEGKTASALALAISTMNDKTLLINKSNQVEHVDPQTVGLIVIDDIFGRYRFDESSFSDWKVRIEFLQSLVKTSNVKVVITTRMDIWRRCQSDLTRFEIFTHIVEVSSLQMRKEEKQEMLRQCLQVHGRTVSQDNVEDFVEQFNLPFGFPSCVNMFAARTDAFQQQDHFFKLPYPFIKEILISMDKEMYATLLFIFYKKNTCCDADLKPPKRMKMVETNSSVTLLKDIAKLVGVNSSEVSLPELRDNLDSLNGILVKHNDKVYSCQNTTIYDCLALYHAERYPEEVTENCTIDFLCRYVHTDETGPTPALIVEPDSFEILAERLMEEVIEKDGTEQIINSNILHSKSFCKFFAETLLESQQMIPFLSGNTNDSSVRKGFLQAFIDKKSDQLCVNIVTQLLDTASNVNNQIWYDKIKSEVKEQVCQKGYQATLESLAKKDG